MADVATCIQRLIKSVEVFIISVLTYRVDGVIFLCLLIVELINIRGPNMFLADDSCFDLVFSQNPLNNPFSII